jgi:DNA-binding CsgD family transcriptional regulator
MPVRFMADGPSIFRGPTVLRGRRSECAALDALLAGMRGGRSGVLLVSGEAGVGKTALLEYAVESASDVRVLRAVGVESEMEVAFAALHQLCAPMLGRLEELPGPQRDALEIVFGLRVGAAPSRLLIGLALLSLLSEVAEERPLLCVVDDAQWLDRASAQAIAFAARRLFAESVVVLFAAREPGDELRGLPELEVRGLRNRDARELLASVLRVPLDEQVRDRIVAETRGNPLALLELPRGLSPAELAGGFGMPDAPGLSGRIEDSFRRRLAGLPTETQRLMLVAAAEPVGDPVLVWQAAQRLGIGVRAAADTDGLLAIGTRVTFRHPLVRSSVYQAASPEERQAVHRALADATDPEVDPDRHAWHRAQATAGVDEDVACELERSAGRAQARGGLAAGAAFLERAAALTLQPALRAERSLAAARANHQAGAFDAALALLSSAESGPLTELQRAQVELLRGQIAFALSRGSDAPPLLLKAAESFEPLDLRLARETYLEALTAAFFAARLAGGVSLLETARAARRAPPSSQPPRAADLLLDGLALLITEGYDAGAPTVKRAVSAFRSEEIPAEERLRWLWLACRAAGLLWDDESWDVLSARFVQLARDAGALSVLPLALSTRSGALVFEGELAIAASLVDEAAAVNDATGSSRAPRSPSQLIVAATAEVGRQEEGEALSSEWATAVLLNGLGRYAEALAAAQQAAEDDNATWSRNGGLVELIEAAARSGKAGIAADALGRLAQTTAASGTDWALGLEARGRALVSDDETADCLFREAIERLARTRVRVELARTHLLYGEWLRRTRRRLDAREQLRHAHELFTRFGMHAFAERARVELEATGEHARKRTAESIDQLTRQELQIAQMARDGLSNPEIGARLFISRRTVKYHLQKVFTKLEISSRGELDRVLPRTPSNALTV